jgi:hypothetical protein
MALLLATPLSSNLSINEKYCIQFASTLRKNYIDQNFEKKLSKSVFFFLYQNKKYQLFTRSLAASQFCRSS